MAEFLSPPQAAKRYGVKPEKIIGFIRRGELRAIDISEKPGVGRPRYRIPLDAIAEFEQRRAAVHAKLKTTPRRGRKPKSGVMTFIK